MGKIYFNNVLDDVEVSKYKKLWGVIQIDKDFSFYVFLESLVGGVDFFQSSQSPSPLDDITEKEQGLKLDLVVCVVLDYEH